MKHPVGIALLLGVSMLAGPSLAADLGECVGIKDDAVRLFCYDRVAGRPPGAASAAATPAASPAASAEASVSAPVVAPAPAAAPEADKSKPPKFTKSRIAGTFEGWSRGTRFKLENGQTWEAIGPGTHHSKRESPEVTIERTLIGQTLMSVEGVSSRAIVRQVE